MPDLSGLQLLLIVPDDVPSLPGDPQTPLDSQTDSPTPAPDADALAGGGVEDDAALEAASEIGLPAPADPNAADPVTADETHQGAADDEAPSNLASSTESSEATSSAPEEAIATDDATFGLKDVGLTVTDGDDTEDGPAAGGASDTAAPPVQARPERPPRTAPHSARTGQGRSGDDVRPRETLVVALGSEPSDGTYVRLDAPDAPPVEAAWSGEAVLRSHPDRFTQLHVVGTAAALDALATRLGVESGEGDVATRVARSIGERSGVRTGCHVVPEAADDLAGVLTALSRIAAKTAEGALSIDIASAGLPLGLALFSSVLHAGALSERLRIASVFSAHEADGARRLLDLGATADLVRWSVAADSLRASGDAAGVAALLPADDPLAAAAARFDAATQGVTAPTLRDDARAFVEALEARPRGDAGLDLVRSALADSARELATAPSDTDALLALALRHLRHRRYATSAVVAWEAVVGRVSQALGLDAGQRDRAAAVAQHLLPEARLLSRLAREATQRRRTGAESAPATPPKRLGGMLGGIVSALRTALATADFDARVTAAAAERTPRPAPSRPGPPRSAPRGERPERPRPGADAGEPRPPRPEGAPGERPTSGPDRGTRPQGDRPYGDRPQGRSDARPDRRRPEGTGDPSAPRERPQGDRARGERPKGDAPRGDRPRPGDARSGEPRREGPRRDGPSDGPGGRPDRPRPDRPERPDTGASRPPRDTIADALPEDVRARLLGLKR